MKQFEISAENRTTAGKGASRRLRRAGKVPAILYGACKDPVMLQLSHDEMEKHLAQEAFYSHILSVNLNDSTEKVVLKDLQRHPFRPRIMHVDLLRVSEHEKLTMRVPIHFVNADKCVGVKTGGGVISHLMTEVEVECLPKDLPEFIAVDLADIAVGTTLHLSDLSLPAGVVAAGLLHGGDPAQPVVSVHIPRVVAAEGEAEAAAAAATEEPAAAAAAEPKPGA